METCGVSSNAHKLQNICETVTHALSYHTYPPPKHTPYTWAFTAIISTITHEQNALTHMSPKGPKEDQ